MNVIQEYKNTPLLFTHGSLTQRNSILKESLHKAKEELDEEREMSSKMKNDFEILRAAMSDMMTQV